MVGFLRLPLLLLSGIRRGLFLALRCLLLLVLLPHGVLDRLKAFVRDGVFLGPGGTTPGPRLEKQAGEGDRQENAQKMDLETSPKGTRGRVARVSQMKGPK